MVINEHVNEAQTYIPDLGIAYPENPDQSMRHPKMIYNIPIDHNFDFKQITFTSKVRRFFIHAGIFCLVFPLNKLLYGIKISGRENIKKNKKLLKDGAMTVCNHVHRWDFPFVLQAVRWRTMYFPAKASNIQTKDKNLILGAGGVPVPESVSAIRKFNEAFNYFNSKKKWIHVFPESCRWAFYQPIRPFKAGAFKMAVKFSIPVLPLAISYRPVNRWRKLLGIKHPLINIKIGEPLFPSEIKAESRREKCNILRDKAHAALVSLAGIKQNKWPSSDE